MAIEKRYPFYIKKKITKELIGELKKKDKEFEESLQRFIEDEKKRDKYVEEYVVEFIEGFEQNTGIKNYFTDFLKRYYKNYDNVLNIIDENVYPRGLDFVLGFIIIISWTVLEHIRVAFLYNNSKSFSLFRDSYLEWAMTWPTTSDDFKSDMLAYWFEFITVSPHREMLGVYSSGIILKGVCLAILYGVTRIEITRLYILHMKIKGLDRDVRFAIYYQLSKRILFWWITTILVFYACPSFLPIVWFRF